MAFQKMWRELYYYLLCCSMAWVKLYLTCWSGGDWLATQKSKPKSFQTPWWLSTMFSGQMLRWTILTELCRNASPSLTCQHRIKKWGTVPHLYDNKTQTAPHYPDNTKQHRQPVIHQTATQHTQSIPPLTTHHNTEQVAPHSSDNNTTETVLHSPDNNANSEKQDGTHWENWSMQKCEVWTDKTQILVLLSSSPCQRC